MGYNTTLLRLDISAVIEKSYADARLDFINESMGNKITNLSPLPGGGFDDMFDAMKEKFNANSDVWFMDDYISYLACISTGHDFCAIERLKRQNDGICLSYDVKYGQSDQAVEKDKK